MRPTPQWLPSQRLGRRWRPRAAPSGTPGAAPLGTTSYPIPTSGAYFVAPTGSDKAAGTQAAPWATLGHAVGTAPNHSTIVMRAGIYREAVVINSKALTIQPYPNEAVIVRGSNIVTGFVQSGTTWVLKNWTYQFPRQNARAVDAQHPLANAPDQVFVDGAPLTQVAKAAQVGAKSFFVDYTAHQLVIGINPAGHTIEASTKEVGLHLEHAAGTIVRGIQFDEYATPASTHGAVLDSSGGAVFENDWFLNNASAGLSIEGPSTLVTHDTMADNGQLGLHANQADHLHVTETEVKQNNTEGFDEHEEAGGMKLSSSNDVLIDDNLADGNYAKGIWFDIASLRATIVRNQTFSNLDEGIQFEISSGAVIAGNVAWRNSGGGIRVIESQHVDIYNNVLYKNQSAVDVWEGSRPQNVADVTIRNNVMMDGSAGATSLLDVHDFTNKLTGAQMGVSTDADAFCRDEFDPTAAGRGVGKRRRQGPGALHVARGVRQGDGQRCARHRVRRRGRGEDADEPDRGELRARYGFARQQRRCGTAVERRQRAERVAWHSREPRPARTGRGDRPRPDHHIRPGIDERARGPDLHDEPRPHRARHGPACSGRCRPTA